jgi:PIN domain nuclease of toxin-antitoxin system
MKVILDTAVAVWLDFETERISGAARQLIEDPEVTCLLSVASIWELEVKSLIGKLWPNREVRDVIDSLVSTYSLEVLSLDREACHQQSRLQMYHRDPFDRLIMCQGIAVGAAIVTPDPAFRKYPVRVIW